MRREVWEVCKEHGGRVSNYRRPRNTGASHANRGPRYADAQTPGASAADDNLTQREQTMVRRKNKGAGQIYTISDSDSLEREHGAGQ